MQRAIGANRIDIRGRIGIDRRRVNGRIPNVVRRKNITAGDLRWWRRGRRRCRWRASGLQGGGACTGGRRLMRWNWRLGLVLDKVTAVGAGWADATYNQSCATCNEQEYATQWRE